MAEVPNAALGCERIQADIVRLRKDRVGALTLEGRVRPGAGRASNAAVTPEGERAIVEAAAHSEAAALAVDADQRHHDQIEPARGDGVAARGAVRNRDAEHPAPRLAGQGVEAQARDGAGRSTTGT